MRCVAIMVLYDPTTHISTHYLFIVCNFTLDFGSSDASAFVKPLIRHKSTGDVVAPAGDKAVTSAANSNNSSSRSNIIACGNNTPCDRTSPTFVAVNHQFSLTTVFDFEGMYNYYFF